MEIKGFNKETLLKFFQWIDTFNWKDEIKDVVDDEEYIEKCSIEIRVNESHAIYADEEFVIKCNINELTSELVKTELIKLGYIDNDFNFFENVDEYHENLNNFHILYNLTDSENYDYAKYDLCFYWSDEINWENEIYNC